MALHRHERGAALPGGGPRPAVSRFYPKKGVAPPNETDPNTDDATPQAVACAERAFTALRSFLASPAADRLRSIVDQGKSAGFTPLFYLWVNDYSRAADPYPHPVRAARLWYWKRKVPDPKRPAGYWKWESTLTRTGECQIPSREQIHETLEKTFSELGR